MKYLSIIIPVYNNTNVRKAILSIPDNEEIEVVVVDGKSTDGTCEVIEALANRIDIYISEKDKGLYDAMNKGIKASTGQWIFTLASDDKLVCNPLEILRLYESENYDILCGSIIIKNKDGMYSVEASSTELSRLECECTLRHPASFFRRSVYESIGFYNTELKCASDREMFLCAYKSGVKIKIIDKIITLFNVGGISTSNPFKYVFKEDVKISDKYEITKYKSRIHLIKRILEYVINRLQEGLHINAECGMTYAEITKKYPNIIFDERLDE